MHANKKLLFHQEPSMQTTVIFEPETEQGKRHMKRLEQAGKLARARLAAAAEQAAKPPSSSTTRPDASIKPNTV
jgi:hypothetical protein